MLLGIEHDVALSAHAFYVGELEVGRRACERLLARPDLPVEAEQMVRGNRTFYTQPLAELAACRFQRLDLEPARDGWSLFNPTILRHGDGFLAIVRSSNYRIVDGQYRMPAEDGTQIRTTNLLVRLTDGLVVVDSRPIAGPEYPKTAYPVDGLEDCRLRQTGSGVGVSATVRNVAPFDGRCRIAAADLDVDAAAFSGLLVLDGVQLQEHEKNWAPIEGRGGWLYAANHDGHVVTVDADDAIPGAYAVSRRRPSPPLARRFRGGSQLVAFDGGWLAVIHEVAHLERRIYEHRFVWFDPDLAVRRVSPPFAFRELRAIEFAAGLAAAGDRLVVSFGVRDAEAWLVELASADVRDLLVEVPPW